MHLYLEVARKSFRRHLVYRTANLAGIAVNFFFSCLRVFIFTSVLGHRTQVAGYNLSQIVTYMCLTEALMMVTGGVGNRELMDSVMKVGRWRWTLYAPGISISTGSAVSLDDRSIMFCSGECLCSCSPGLSSG